MFFIIAVLLLISVFIGQNKKIKDSSKTGWFIFIAIAIALYLIFSVL